MRVLYCFVMAFLMHPIMHAQARGEFTPSKVNIQLPAFLSIPGSLAIGSVIWSSAPVFTRLGGAVVEPNMRLTAQSYRVSGFEDVFQTNVPGIGVRYNVYYTSRDNPGGVKLKPVGLGGYTTYPIKNWVNGDSYQQKFSIELVKVGSVSATSAIDVPSLWMALCYDIGDACGGQFQLTISGASSIKVGPSCKVSTPVIAVQLGKVSLSSFANLGDTSSPSYFSISLSCTGGDVGVSIYPYITLTDVVSPGNTSDILSLSPGSTAGGMGIQIFHGDDLLKFGPDSSAPDNINRWKAGEIKRGEALFQIPLRARYVRTGNILRPGSANGQVTFTFSWR